MAWVGKLSPGRGNIFRSALIVAVILGASIPAIGASTGTAMCGGKAATITGTSGNDVIDGTSGPDVIVGLGGNDEIDGHGGNDTICGGGGADNIDGDFGSDTLIGGQGRDELDGDSGNDVLRGGRGNDDLDANAGDDTLNGGPGFDHGEGFFRYLRDAFDVLYAEGAAHPKMMSVGLHCRLAGRPGRAAALARFLDYAGTHERVWITTRADIARHWRDAHPYPDRR